MSEAKIFKKWVGFGILGLFLLAGIYALIIYQSRFQNQQNWSSINAGFTDFTVDTQGKAWGLSDKGITFLDTTGQFEWIALDNKLIERNPLSLAVDSKGRFWVGTYGSSIGIRELNGEWKIFDTKEPTIYDIVVDEQDRAWIQLNYYGTGGFGAIDPANEIGATQPSSNYGLNKVVISIATDQQGRVWCITGDGQLMLYGDNGKWLQQATLPENPSTGTALAIDKQGLAWVSSTGKVFHLSPDNQWTTHTLSKMTDINVLMIDHQGRVWAGGAGGVFVFDAPVGWIDYDSKNSGLTDDYIQHLAVDGKNKVWIATMTGLNQFDAGTALSPAARTQNRDSSKKINILKGSLPSIAVGIVLIVILGITFTAPQAFGIIKNTLHSHWQKIKISSDLLIFAFVIPLITPFMIWLVNNDNFNEFVWGTFGELGAYISILCIIPFCIITIFIIGIVTSIKIIVKNTIKWLGYLAIAFNVLILLYAFKFFGA